jgi:hypothetical protein
MAISRRASETIRRLFDQCVELSVKLASEQHAAGKREAALDEACRLFNEQRKENADSKNAWAVLTKQFGDAIGCVDGESILDHGRHLLRERNELRAERDALREDLKAEREGNMDLRKRFGARDDETFPQFVERLVCATEVAVKGVAVPATQEEVETHCKQGQQWCHVCHKIECCDNTHPRFPPVRTRLPDERQSITRRWELKKPPHLNVCPKCAFRWEEEAAIKIYCTVGLKPDGTPGEMFIHADKAGSTARGALDHLAMAISIGLQHGISLRVYIEKMIGSRYGAGGYTGDKQYPRVGSIGDLVGQWTRDKFFPKPKEEKKA